MDKSLRRNRKCLVSKAPSSDVLTKGKTMTVTLEGGTWPAQYNQMAKATNREEEMSVH